MEYRLLGRTGLRVSCLSLGTVELGLDYGIRVPGEFGPPPEDDAVRLLKAAADNGINFFDTARAYSNSEEILGKALAGRSECIIATKVSVPTDHGHMLVGPAVASRVMGSLDACLLASQRDVIDIAQIHNATVDVINQGEVVHALLEAQHQGKVRYLGASVYTEAEALAVINARCFDTLQIPYSLLDQRMAQRVFPAAESAGVGIIARSALLKGALTAKAKWLPPELVGLRQAADRARGALAASWELLPEMALRFCLSASHIATVLVGIRTLRELKQALAAVEAGPLSNELLTQMPALALVDERLLNPSYWPVP